MLAFLEYEYGIFHPIGGLGSVSERMASIAKDLGSLPNERSRGIGHHGRRRPSRVFAPARANSLLTRS